MQTSVAIGSPYSSGENWNELVDFSLEAERLGVDQLWSAEAWGMDSVVPLAYLAAKTNTITLGTRIMQISARVPAMIAMTVQSLSTVSNGRFILGLGVSGPQVVEGLHGVAFNNPLGRMRECIEIIRMGLSGEHIKYAGKHYRLPRPGGEGKPLRLAQTPRPELPIYLATLGPKSLELTGELADGWLGTTFIPEHAEIFLDPIKKGATKAGRSINDMDIQVDVSVEISDDVERSIEKRKPGMAFVLGGMGSAKTNFYNQAFCRSGYEDAAKEVQRLWFEGKKTVAVNRVPDEIIMQTSLIGTEEMVKQRLRAYRDAGVTTVNLEVGGDSSTERIDRLTRCLDVIKQEVASWH